MKVEEALAQLRDHTLMTAAMLAYNVAATEKGVCEETALMIADGIRALMRPQQ